ncbi:hypothetical protein P9W85_24780 [Bacillus tropicus]|uniref:hypothetical protein n=1 Tax=Bacillus tropicus TaxID=2026188 RepID=UPI002DB8E3FB|nr:hypothetical protein [Bacillus tropicus]MEC2554535.1 hypothetical protein [Bacillus tropicus]
MDNQKNEMKLGIVELRIQVVGLQQTIEELLRRVTILEAEMRTKAGITHVQETIQQSEIIKKINGSKSVGMNSKVWLSLDGKVSLESIVEQTTDGFKMTATDIKGIKTKEDSQND